MANLLETCQQIAVRIGLPRPIAVLSGDSQIVPQYFALMCETAKDLIRRHDWQCLEQEVTFLTVPGDIQIGNLRVAYPDLRRIKEDSVANITRNYPMLPLARDQHRAVKLAPPATTQGAFYRVRGDQFLMPGNTAADDEIVFEYISSYWATTSGDSPERIAVPASDTDILLLDDEALILGVKWRFKKENGLEYGEDFSDYEKYVQELIGSDTPRETLSLSPTCDDGFIAVRAPFSIAT